MIFLDVFVPLKLLEPTEYEIKNYAKQGRFYPAFVLQLGPNQLFQFQVEPRHPNVNRKTRRDHAIKAQTGIVKWGMDYWHIHQVFWYLYQFKLSDEGFIQALLFMGWEGPVIGDELLKAIEQLKAQAVEVPYTLCMPCHASGYFPDKNTYCETCLGVGSYALYDEPYFQPLRVMENGPGPASDPPMLHPLHALNL